MIHHGRVSLLFPGVNGLRMLGVVHEAVVFLLEQLYGSKHCRSYHFRFHKPEETDEPPINPHGSARAEINHRLGRDFHAHTHIHTSLRGWVVECLPRLFFHRRAWMPVEQAVN